MGISEIPNNLKYLFQLFPITTSSMEAVVTNNPSDLTLRV